MPNEYDVPQLSRSQFKAAYGREPRMTGEYDYEAAEWLCNDGWDMFEVTCLGDDIPSYVKGQRHL